MKQFKRILIFSLLLCLGLAGCGPARPADGHAGGSTAPETVPVVTMPQPSEPGTEPDGPAPQTAAGYEAWLPSFSLRDSREGGATYEHVTEAEAAAWASSLEAEGFTLWEGSFSRLLYTDRLILRLDRSEWEEGVYMLYWYEAAPNAPLPDPEAVRAMLPDRELICLVDRTPEGMFEATGIRKLACASLTDPPDANIQAKYPDGRFCAVGEFLLGPEGCVPQQGYYGGSGSDPLWADLDGDGEAEYVYWTYGPTSGLFTVAFWACGLERGVPVVKAQSILNLSWGEISLEKEGDALYFVYGEQKFDPDSQTYIPQGEQRIPLRIEDGAFVFGEGELPEGIQNWGGPDWYPVGSSFTEVRERLILKNTLLIYDSMHCVIWQEPQEVWDADGEARVPVTETLAMMTTDGVSVTGYVSFYPTQYGLSGWRAVDALIETPADPGALAALSPEGLRERFGPCHFDNGSGGLHLYGWFTEDGKLLRAAVTEDRVLCAAVIEPGTGELLAEAGPLADAHLFDYAEKNPPRGLPFADKAEPDVVTVFEYVPSVMINAGRWEAFRAAAEAGQPDEITIRLFYKYSSGEAGASLGLRFDGTFFRLQDEDRLTSYKYLLVSDQNEPPAQAKFKTATHYLLSDDPDMTHDRYFSHMVSSVWDQDFPATRSVFTLYFK